MVAKGPTGLSTFSRLLAAFGVFLLGYMIVAVGRPVALAMKAAAEAAATRARSVVQPAQVIMDVSSISTAELEHILEQRKRGAEGSPAPAAPSAPAEIPSAAVDRQQERHAVAAPERSHKMPAEVGPEVLPLPVGDNRGSGHASHLIASLFPKGPVPEVNPAHYKLSKDVAERHAKHNMLMVTWANFHYLDFTINWVYHVKKLGITNYLVGAMDDKILNELVARGINTFSMQSGLSVNDFGWGSPTFHKMGREKINLIGIFTSMGVDLLLSDVDTVWSRDPIPYILRYPEADVLTSSDHLTNTVNKEALEKWPNAASAANIGIMFFRAKTPGARQLAKNWSKALENNPQYWDQNAFNDLFRRGNHPSAEKHLFLAYDKKIKLGILPVSIFASGHTYFVQKLADRLHMTPYVVHATFQFSGTPGKRNRFRESLMWLDPPEYFDRPGGYLSFDMDIPPEMLKSAGPSPSSLEPQGTIGHFKLAHHQIRQIRNAFAIGLLLGRAVVIPQLWCGLDRWWAPHAGTIPGSHFKLPFPCPLDHILDLEQMIREVPHFGAKLEWREHSFLSNPLLPRLVHESRVNVTICARDEGGCVNGDHHQLANGVVRLQPGLDDHQIRAALEPFKDMKLIHFSSMLGAFGGHASQEDAGKFEERTKHYTSLWCCSQGHPGHIWYDMWFDKVPRRDRHNREWNGEWVPKMGP